MNRRLTLLALVTILVAAVAVPAIGQEKLVSPTIDSKTSVRALAKARLALLTARSAKSESRRAARTAQAALNAANETRGIAGDAKAVSTATQAALQSTAIKSAFVAEPATTTSESFVPLAGGPSVTVDVSASGLIEVWAQVKFEEEGSVALYEDGKKLPGQAPECGSDEEGTGLLAVFVPEEMTLATPSGFPFAPFCGTSGAPGSVLFQTTPGRHTYELRYQIGCGCEPEATFSNRLLRVGPRL